MIAKSNGQRFREIVFLLTGHNNTKVLELYIIFCSTHPEKDEGNGD
jgi:hypothetical protein